MCKKPLPLIDINSISDETIILNAGEWIGKSGDTYIEQTKDFNIWKTAFLKNKYLGLDLGSVDKGYVEISREKIEDITLKYLTILENRTKSNQHLLDSYISLKTEFDSKKKGLIYKLGGSHKATLKMMIILAFFIILFPLILILVLIF
jgi:hypothetical protein